jgi:hypothetical protein
VKNTASGSRASKSWGYLSVFLTVSVPFLDPAVMPGNNAIAVAVVAFP